ncbi:hypothetical protein BpHYR1_020934 [Brachionus plicatilis]|uniref:Helitron helicase-like domain-containing protein n=1 Tax=Brachionus plicatilis TaxID=10195 RepID=A0A3M7RR12_BRAPC|nr:hypothetical protein BpHYR1_020934 [Brachionus plicatilis]
MIILNMVIAFLDALRVQKRMPSLFLTLTANDSWCELKSILYGKKKSAAIFNPFEDCEFFYRTLNLVMKEIKSDNGVLGKVENY